MSHRPYPDVDRARHQLERGHAPEPPRCPACTHFVSRHALEDGQPVCTRGQGLISCRDCAELWARTPAVAALVNFGIAFRHGTGRHVLTEQPRRTGKTATTAAIVDEAVKAGEHVHVAGRDGTRCAGGEAACPLPRIQRGDQVVVEHDGQRARYEVAGSPVHDHRDGQPVGLSVAFRPVDGPTAQPRCPGCGHDQHAPGTECEAGVDHGPNRWHRCLCLATPGASRACPAQMDCQGGPLGYADIAHLRAGRSLRGANGETITPDVLAEAQPIVLARVVRTCTAVPSQWNAWTVEGQYLYLRYRSGIGTVDAYDTEDSEQWTRIPDGAVARFDTGDRLDGEMDLTEFCERAGLQLADDAEVTGE